MKLYRLAPLVGCALASASWAQSNQVTLYGIVDEAVRYSKGLREFAPAPNSNAAVVSGANETSRWGMRGSEDLGGGLSAIFLLEGGINVDTGSAANTTKLFDRYAWVGLQSKWGSVVGGRNRNLLGDNISPVDPLNMRLASFNPNINVASLSQHNLGVEYGPAASTTNSYRLDNSIKYVGTFSGLTVNAMYAFGEQKSMDLLESYGAGAQYQVGDLVVSGAYQKFESATTLPLKAWISGAAYKFGSVRTSLTYSKNSADTNATTTVNNQTIGVGVALPLTGSLDLIAAYYDVKRDQTGKPDDGFGRLVAFFEYGFSRRTKGYVETDFTNWRGNYQGVANKTSAQGVSVGVVHRF
jgi:predicted porin